MTDDLRDTTEITLARWALDADLPILGVCRGVQTLNVSSGGTLLQDVTALVPGAIRHQYAPEKPRSYVAHDLSTIPNSRLATILGPQARVNSFHHQAVERAGEGLVVCAIAPDGVIEALEGRGQRFTIGVQWHPEGTHPQRSGDAQAVRGLRPSGIASCFSRDTPLTAQRRACGRRLNVSAR